MKIGGIEITFGKKANKSYPVRKHTGFKYDGAQTDNTNARHWANADGLSADEANNPLVRKVTRDRVRYERANNSYFGGMTDTYGEAVVGTMPRVQFMDPDNQELNAAVELAFNDWAQGTEMGTKLLVAFTTAVGDGETFLIETTTDKNLRSPVKLNYMLIDCDRCTSGFLSNEKNNVDGVLLNDKREVISYTFLKDHPGGDTWSSANPDSLIKRPADQVIHYFKKQRPEQHRGISELIAALPLGAKLRSFTLSTLNAAHIASTFSGVLHTTSGAFDDEDSEGAGSPDFESFDTFSLDNGMLLTLPKGWDMKQVKAENPTSTYKEFKRELVAETARSIGMPVNVALGDSSGFNFSSGRLDRLGYRKVIKIRQADFSNRVLWPLFKRWLDEAVLIEGLLPMEMRLKLRSSDYTPRWTWFFDGDAAIDPVKEATANQKNLDSLSITHREIYAERGMDYRVAYKQRSDELKEQAALNLTPEDLNPTPAAAPATASSIEEIAIQVSEILLEEGNI